MGGAVIGAIFRGTRQGTIGATVGIVRGRRRQWQTNKEAKEGSDISMSYSSTSQLV